MNTTLSFRNPINAAIILACFLFTTARAGLVPLYPVNQVGTNTACIVLSLPHVSFPSTCNISMFPNVISTNSLSIVSEAARLGMTNDYAIAAFANLFDPAIQAQVSLADYDVWRAMVNGATNVTIVEKCKIGNCDIVVLKMQMMAETMSTNELDAYIADAISRVCTNSDMVCATNVSNAIRASYADYTNTQHDAFWHWIVLPVNGTNYLRKLKIDNEMTPITMRLNALARGLTSVVDTSYTYSVSMPALPFDGTNQTQASILFNGWVGRKRVSAGGSVADGLEQLFANTVSTYQTGSDDQWLSLWVEAQKTEWAQIVSNTNSVYQSVYQNERNRFSGNVYLVMKLDCGDDKYVVFQVCDGKFNNVGPSEDQPFGVIGFHKNATTGLYDMFRGAASTNEGDGLPVPSAFQLLQQPFFMSQLDSQLSAIPWPNELIITPPEIKINPVSFYGDPGNASVTIGYNPSSTNEFTVIRVDQPDTEMRSWCVVSGDTNLYTPPVGLFSSFMVGFNGMFVSTNAGETGIGVLGPLSVKTVNTNGSYVGPTSLYFRVTSTNELGHSIRSVTNLCFVGQTNSVLLSWQAKTGATGYIVEKSSNGSEWTQYVAIASAATTNLLDTGANSWMPGPVQFDDCRIRVVTDVRGFETNIVPIRVMVK